MSLFSESLISPDVKKKIASGYIIRPLHSADYEKGFLQTLSSLTTVGSISKEQFIDRFNYLKGCKDTYYTIVVEDVKNAKVIGAGTIFVERKFVHTCGLVGHIEDIVTAESARGLNLGRL
ncbi:Glucosamine-phosphate N-acetyltransferase-like protein, partial [Entophlyctis luteolus]